jgi:branched-chain amino acid transport system permease protein
MHVFFDELVSGLALGSIYALVALSINIMFRPVRAFNFAQGEIVLLAGVLSVSFMVNRSWPWLAAAVVIVAISAGIGGATELIGIRPVLSRNPGSSAWVLTTLAISLIMDNVIGLIYNGASAAVPYPPLLSGTFRQLGPAQISSYQAALIVLVIILTLASTLFHRSGVGLGILALAEDRDIAVLRGVPAKWLGLGSWMVGGAAAGLAGILIVPIAQVSDGLGTLLLINGFMAAVIGGVGGSDIGALIGGWIVGLAAAFGGYVFGSVYSTVASVIVFLIILALRPNGLAGLTRMREV